MDVSELSTSMLWKIMNHEQEKNDKEDINMNM